MLGCIVLTVLEHCVGCRYRLCFQWHSELSLAPVLLVSYSSHDLGLYWWDIRIALPSLELSPYRYTAIINTMVISCFGDINGKRGVATSCRARKRR
jgi:hypothetical protein